MVPMRRRDFLSTLAAAPLFGQADRQRHVVIISIDGFAAYALNDAQLPLPTFRRLAREGAAAEAMEPVNPTVTWPNHTSIITGVTPSRHMVLYNGLAVRGGEGAALKVEPWVDKPELVKAPTLYDAAHSAGLSTAEVDWVAIHNAKTITHAFPEVPRLTDPVVKEMIAAGTVTEENVRTFNKGSIVWRDELWTLAGQHIIEKHKPNLLLFHLLTTDSSQHRYGASSLAAHSALALADAKVQRLLDSLRRAGILERTAVFIVSDHGFKTYKHVIHANALLRQKGVADVWVIPEGGTAMVYITRESRKAELLPVLRGLFAAVPGVAEVLDQPSFSKYGYPAQPSGQMCDLVLVGADGHAFGGSQQGEAVVEVPTGSTPGAHGYISTDRAMDAVFIASGAGIKKGVKLGRIRNLDVAPTAARLLGLEMRGVEGRVLNEVLA
jgi:predicted AlkP superfamily pyrophosphatase or phosphodiesterase